MVVMDGGLIQDIVSYDKNLIGRNVIVLDYDAEGADDYVIDTDGAECLPRRETIRKISRRRCGVIRKLVKEREVLL